MESCSEIQIRSISPIRTSFHPSCPNDHLSSSFPSTSSSTLSFIPGMKKSGNNESWLFRKSLELDQDKEQRSLLENPQPELPKEPWRIGKISTFALISIYFSLNLILTFHNKFIMIKFPFPYFITALHAGSGTLGCLFLRGIGVQFKTVKRETKDELERGSQLHQSEKSLDVELAQQDSYRCSSSSFSFARISIVLLYSTLYAANIAISNASLRLVSVPFHQIVRSTCPIFTLAIGFLLLAKKPKKASLLALLPVVLGAALACFGDMNATRFGIFLTVLGTALAALKTVVTNLLQGGNKETKEQREDGQELKSINSDTQQESFIQRCQSSIQTYAFHYTALELLEVMSPLACVQCLLASHFSGELQDVYIRFVERTITDQFDWSLLFSLAINGCTAFLLNVVSFQTNKVAGPLTMTVVGNLKQVITILLAFHLFHLHVRSINISGIMIALFGTAWYGTIEWKRKYSIKNNNNKIESDGMRREE